MIRPTQVPAFSPEDIPHHAQCSVLGAAMGARAPQSAAAQRHPQRHGVLKFGTRTDAAGLDSHRNNQLPTSTPTAAMYTGLTDYDQQGTIIPPLPAGIVLE